MIDLEPDYKKEYEELLKKVEFFAEIMTLVVSTTLFDCMRPYVDNIVNICKALCMDPYGDVIIEGTKTISEFSKAGDD